MTTECDRVSMVVVGLRFGQYIVEDQLRGGPGEPFVNLVGVCDLDQELAATMAAKNKLKQYASLDEILADPTVDAVGLFTGPAGRADLIRKCMRAGKHVMTTKPFEVNAAEALSVLREARELGKAVHLNSPGPLPVLETQQILDWIEAYDLGRPVSVLWETHANYFQKADGSWYDDPERCPVAPIFRLGIYGINQIVRVLGAVEQVNVVSSRIRTGRPTADNAVLSLRFANGAVGAIHASFCVKDGYPYPDNLKLNFERGSISTAPLDTDRYGTSRKKLTLQMEDESGRVHRQEICFGREGKAGMYQWAHFRDAVANGGVVPGEISPEQVAAGVQVINAMAEAEKTGQSVRITPLS